MWLGTWARAQVIWSQFVALCHQATPLFSLFPLCEMGIILSLSYCLSSPFQQLFWAGTGFEQSLTWDMLL